MSAYFTAHILYSRHILAQPARIINKDILYWAQLMKHLHKNKPIVICHLIS